jgi:hypothetical protein
VQKYSLSPAIVHTDIPFRLDRLPLSRFHVLVVVGLGITWILDGLEVTIVGSLGPALQSAHTLHLSSANLGAVASFYVAGAVTGALGFGWITDRFGRRLVFYVTLIVYLRGVLLSALAWDFWSFAFFRMITGLGAAAGALVSPVLLDQNLLPVNVGWRLGFGIGGVLGLQFRLPHSKRNISPRNTCAGHCLLLRARHRHRRQHFAPLVRLADRIRIGLAGELRIYNRRAAAARRGGD